MVGLTIAKIETIETKDNWGRFLAAPLDKGFGITLGNALRRVLLGHLPGAAITRVRIWSASGQIQHEFSTIPHVKEDTLEFLLNVRAIRLKSLSGQPGMLTLEVAGGGQVFAVDIKPSTDFEIVNPELYLLTLDSADATLRVEFDVELGRGYKSAESTANLSLGTIPVDAIFAPVRKVNFAVKPYHVSQEVSREQLFLEVWTDGTMSPLDAIGQSADILVEELTPLRDYPRAFRAKVEELAGPPPISDERYNIPVEQMDLSVRTMNCLRRAGITTVGEILKRGEKELMSLRNFGEKSKQELESKLNVLGLSLSGKKEEVVPPEEAAEVTTSEKETESSG